MEKLNNRIHTFTTALSTLRSILAEPETVIVRDAALQRFEYTFEALWKALKNYLYEIEGIPCNSPKACFRSAMESGVISSTETETCLRMTDDRNLTSHTYIEEIAKSIYAKLPTYLAAMTTILKALNTGVEDKNCDSFTPKSKGQRNK